MTERESLDLSELKMELAREYNYTCPICGGSLFRYGTYQLAHRIAQTKPNIKKYGKEIIHNKKNLVPVCSLGCNSSCNIGFNPEESRKLVEEIKLNE